MNVVTKSREFALSEIEKFGAPHLIHFEIAERKAIQLAEQLGADKEVVQTGVYLMDVKLGQAMQEGKLAQHVEMSSVASREFLTQFKLPATQVNQIINCVEAHHGAIPFASIEAEIVANADCYRFIHPKGFFLFLTVLGKRGSFAEALDMAEAKLDEKHTILSLDFCKNELEEVYRGLKNYISMARQF
jgi:HD superfamily phosphodiesterase